MCGIGQFEFQVRDEDSGVEVDLLKKECTCGKFQVIRIPCVHALNTTLKRKVNLYSLCSNFCTIEAWKKRSLTVFICVVTKMNVTFSRSSEICTLASLQRKHRWSPKEGSA